MIKTPVVVKTEEDFDGRPIALLAVSYTHLTLPTKA